MAEEMNHSGMTPYEMVKVAHMSNRGDKAVGIVGLVLAGVGAVAGVTGWVYANSQAKRAQEVANAKNDATQKQLELLTNLLSAERNERISGDRNLSISINDTVSGQQSGQLTASQIATNEATAQIMTGVMTGRYVEKPQPVALYQDARPCSCPASNGCGCGD